MLLEKGGESFPGKPDKGALFLGFLCSGFDGMICV